MISLDEYRRAVKRDNEVARSPYLQGVRACNWGKSRLACPYTLGTKESKAWHDGFDHADDLFAAQGR